jgi:hypothetical protein
MWSPVPGSRNQGRVEFVAARLPSDDWRALIGAIKQDFGRFGPQMREVRQSLTRWSLFINPFRRVQMTLMHFAIRLKSFELKEPGPGAMAMTEAEAKAMTRPSRYGWGSRAAAACAVKLRQRLRFTVPCLRDPGCLETDLQLFDRARLALGCLGSLFVPKRANRIKTSGAPGWHHAGENREDGDGQDRAGGHDWVERVRGDRITGGSVNEKVPSSGYSLGAGF